MTAYQKYWNSEIELLLRQLDAPESLHNNIIDTVDNMKHKGVFQIKLLMPYA